MEDAIKHDTTPKSLWPFEKILKRLEALSYIVIILGIPTFFFQQWQHSKTTKIEHTLSYIETFRGEGLVASRTQLLLPWIEYVDELQLINSSNGITEDVLQDWVNDIIDASFEKDKSNNLQMHMYNLTEFYDQLLLCVETALCDKDKAHQYFGANALQFNAIYGYRIRRLNKELNLQSFGKGLEYFSKQTNED